jgi:hypothetical protein
MQSSLIGKIQKAHLYAQEPDRIAVADFTATFRGDHDSYQVAFHDGTWSCTCSFNPEYGVCSHVLATQRLMGPIAPGDLGWLAVEETPARR